MLEDDQLFQQVKADFTRRFPHTADRGRHSTPIEAILRLLLVKHLSTWSFQESEERVVQLARRARVTQGRKLRVDATCVPITIHHPTE